MGLRPAQRLGPAVLTWIRGRSARHTPAPGEGSPGAGPVTARLRCGSCPYLRPTGPSATAVIHRRSSPTAGSPVSRPTGCTGPTVPGGGRRSLLSSFGLALWAVALTTGAAADFWEGVKEGARGSGILALRQGDCFNSTGALEGWATDADRVPCTREHDGEVFAVVPLPDGAYPGHARLTDAAAERCQGLLQAYVMDTWTLPGHVDVYHLTPSEEGWDLGDREIT
ncbi:hypothetical protein GCM10010297_03340 [Streptomyces malachitofuscus]|nr:hypothetical protein GCM10010297_03340 [Streptomyces malachitofuscus]